MACSRLYSFFLLSGQDARHLGRYGTEGQLAACLRPRSSSFWAAAAFAWLVFPVTIFNAVFPSTLTCSRCSESWSVWTRRTVRRSSSCSAMACAGMVCLLRCTTRCVPLIVGLRHRQRWVTMHITSVCRLFVGSGTASHVLAWKRNVDMSVVVLDRCLVSTCRKMWSLVVAVRRSGRNVCV